MGVRKVSLLALVFAVGCESPPSLAEAAEAVVGVIAATEGRSSSETKPSTPSSPSSSESGQSSTDELPPGVDAVIVDNGQRYEVVDGNAYRVNGSSRTLVDQLYDPEYLDKNYAQRSGGVYRVDGSRSFLASRSFQENFAGITDVRQLVGPERGWTFMTLQSPRAPDTKSYNDLAGDVLSGDDFKDNTLSLVDDGPGHRTALRTQAVAPSGRTDVSKSSLDTGLVYFEPGDTFTVSGSFKIEGAMPVTIIDLESSYIKDGPGLRLVLDPSGRPRIELKWGTKPTILSAPGTALRRDVWQTVEMTCRLDVIQGRCTLDIDGERVLDGYGPTFPVRGEAYDRLQIGVTAHDGSTGNMDSIVYIDDFTMTRS